MLETFLTQANEAQAEGRWGAALEHFEAAFQAAVRGRDVGVVADVLRRIGAVHTERGDSDMATEVFEVSLEIARRSELPDRVASALICIAANEQRCGRFPAAEALYGEARDIAGELGNDRLIAMVETNIGAIANICGEVHSALEHYRRALDLGERVGDRLLQARVLHNMGMAHVDLSEWTEAASCLERARRVAHLTQDLGTIANIEVSRAELSLKRGQFEAAREHCDRAFELFGQIDSEAGLAEVHKHYGVLYRETRKPQLADSNFTAAIRMAREGQDRLLEAEVMSEWALVHLEEQRNREALQCLNGAHHLFSELSARRELLDLDRRLDGLEATYMRVVQAWGESIESKDRYTAGHCERVANFACMLAQAVGITGRDLTWLRMGGYLHDVGKIAVPAEVLNKPGKLSDEEFRLMKRHTEEGDRIVAELNFPWDIRPAVRSHHERWDGSGYPDGLSGEEIPLTARILCVADVYDALTTTRSYRRALSRTEALEIMLGDVGRIFDPELFAVFRSLICRAAPASDARFPAFDKRDTAAA